MSMIESRLKPSTTCSSAHVPGSSGPRWRIRCDAPATASTVSEVMPLAGSETRASSPHTAASMPHILGSPPRRHPDLVTELEVCRAR